MRVLALLILWCAPILAESPALDNRIARPSTDGRIAAYEKLAGTGDVHDQNLLAGAYIQKMRETTDFGYIDRAARIVHHLLSAAPENTAWCLVDLGNLYFKTGRLAEAEESYRSALRTFYGYYPAYAGLGRVQAAQGKFDDAITSLKRAQSAVPMPEYAAALADLYAR